jgi:hypothetical protein
MNLKRRIIWPIYPHTSLIGTVFGIIRANSDFMFPVWFFIILIVVIGYLLYVTRTTEDNFIMICKNHGKRIHCWLTGKTFQ